MGRAGTTDERRKLFMNTNLEWDLQVPDYEDTRRAMSVPTHKQIEKLAYNLYLRRGKRPGHELEDWLAAEEQLRREFPPY
jgi:hypothetical protein